MSALHVGFAVYLVNLAVGVAAQLFAARFGVLHHVLYAVVFVAAAAAAALEFHPALLITLIALAVFPRARPRTPWHPLLGVIGLVGYVAAAVT